MNSNQVAQGEPPNPLENTQVPLQVKLAAAWTSFMFLYVYADILNFYKPGVIDDILAGIVFEFDITPTWAITALTLLAIPIFMVVLSTTLPARANRITNLIVASLQVPFAAFNVVGEVGESWMYFYGLGFGLEVLLLAFILRAAWTWAPHVLGVGARARGAASLAGPGGTVGTWLRSEPPV